MYYKKKLDHSKTKLQASYMWAYSTYGYYIIGNGALLEFMGGITKFTGLLNLRFLASKNLIAGNNMR